MPSTQLESSLSTQKFEVVNKQPPAAPVMSTDPDVLDQRAMRLRGGCFVRHSRAVPMPITYTFFRNALCPVGAASYRAVVEESAARILRGVFLYII